MSSNTALQRPSNTPVESPADVTIIDSGVANLASIRAALERLGLSVEVTDRPEAVRRAKRVVLPGVGSFARAMEALRSRDLETEILRVDDDGRPLLAICLGQQLLTQSSEESPGVAGLGLIDIATELLPETARTPHLGWNGVEPIRPTDGGACAPLAAGYAAFAHSYAVLETPPGWQSAISFHGALPFVAALSRGRTLACQFHPELSGRYGQAVLQRWAFGPSSSTPASDPSRSGEGGRGVCVRLVPCLDVLDGRVVKGVQFQGLRDSGDPAARAELYAKQGADEIVLLDIGASPNSRGNQLETVRAVRRSLDIPLTVGGGVREEADGRALLSAGADKLAVNTAAIARPELLSELVDAFGSQAVVLAVDVRRRPSIENGSGPPTDWELLVNGGRRAVAIEPIAWLRIAAEAGVGEILLTSWDRDGTGRGPDQALLAAARDAIDLPIIYSGGLGTVEHFATAFQGGADAALAASIFHDDSSSVGEVKSFLRQRGVEVTP